MKRERINELAAQAGVRFCGNWIEGPQNAIYKFVELIVRDTCGEDYWVWPDGSYCLAGDEEYAQSMSDDRCTVRVVSWNEHGEPVFEPQAAFEVRG